MRREYQFGGIGRATTDPAGVKCSKKVRNESTQYSLFAGFNELFRGVNPHEEKFVKSDKKRTLLRLKPFASVGGWLIAGAVSALPHPPNSSHPPAL